MNYVQRMQSCRKMGLLAFWERWLRTLMDCYERNSVWFPKLALYMDG